ncbi:hypothetical protein CPLU01_12830 [Colletotrichum plurivorum]|uniref:Uncharacterized protein n=1 Tax=Colletotrichum plurivorum TaxID=2175906 RepID=A0A8H6JWY1_9PEZI|nr:hypothetical protein CPLU01_12830 [Colletotrichum plurivorum]
MASDTPHHASATVRQLNRQRWRELLRRFLAYPHPLCPWELGSDGHTRRQHISSAHGGVQLLACGDILGRDDAHDLDFHVDACDYCKRDEVWPEMSMFAHLSDLLHDDVHRELRHRGIHDVFLELSRQKYPDDVAHDNDSYTRGVLPAKLVDIKHAELAMEATNADNVP